MAKRTATSELNHDNWNKEEIPEEAGTFQKAAPDVMQHRVVKAARRRSVGTPENNATKSPFAAFGGFKATPSSSTSSSSTFSFLTKNANETPNGDPVKTVESDNRSSEYYSQLKGLNQCVSQWIKSHVDSNPFCILTPIFKDYERYLSEIDEKEQNKSKDVEAAPEQQKPPEKPNPVSNTETNTAESDAPKSKDDSETPKAIPFTMSSFGSSSAKFNFGTGATSTNSTLSAGFTFGSSQPFSFSNVAKPETKKDDAEEDEDQPPKVEFTPVVEEGAIYSKRCKVFVKKAASYQERGVGMLYLKPVNEKTQLIVRADTILGNLLVNTILSSGMPAQRMGANNVMLVCVPTPDTEPPPIPVLLRFKTGEDADEALDKLKTHIK